jgi:competence protein ComEC
LRIALPFIAGIISMLAIPTDIPVNALFWIDILGFTGLLFSYLLLRSNFSFRWMAGIFTYLSLFVTGASMVAFADHRNKPVVEANAGKDPGKVYLCRVEVPPVQKARSIAGNILLIAEMDSLRQWSQMRKKVLVYFKDDSLSKSLNCSDLIVISAAVQPIPGPANPHMFNYRQYLMNRQIYCQVFLEPGRWRLLGRMMGNPVRSGAEKCREKCLEIFTKFKVEGQDLALLSALLLGSKDLLEKDVIQEFSHAGAMHVLCVSGLHVGIMYVVADKVLFFLKRGRKSRKVHQILIIACIWAYAFIAGLPSSVVRAALMFSLIAAGKMFKRSSESYNIIAVAAFFQLMINPYDITQVGFQLSYIAVLGIFTFYRPFNEMVNPKNKIVSGIWSILAVSMAAQLATFPLACHYFNMFPVYFLLTNLIVVPLAAVITYFAVFLIAVGSTGLAFGWLAFPLKWSLRFMSGSVDLIQSWPGAVIEPVILTPAQVILIYTVIAGIFIFWVLSYRKGAFLILGALLLFVIATGKGIYEKLKTSGIDVYQVSGHTAVELIHDRQSVFICDSLLMTDMGAIEFQVKPNRMNLRIKDIRGLKTEGKIIQSFPGAWINYPFVFFRGKTIVIIDSRWENPQPGETLCCDVAVISGSSWISPETLIMHVVMNQVIIDSSVPFYRAELMMQFFRKENIPCHSVRHSGAFELRW